MANEIRKIPKKTMIIIGSLIGLGIVSFILASAGKATKAKGILEQLEYKNVSKIRVYKTQEILNEEINVKGMRYNVSFFDNETGQECKGYIVKDYKHNVFKDLICKKATN